MKILYLVIASALLAAAPSALHAQPNNNCQPADPIVKWCAPGTDSILPLVYINASLDAGLETGFGDEAGRNSAFAQAVEDWNAALVAVGAKVRLRRTNDVARWAIDQGNPDICDDAVDANANVFPFVGGGHIGNGENATSTGHNHGGAHQDPAMNPIGPGWIIPIGADVSDTTTGFNIDRILAITVTQVDPANEGCIIEGDIFWLTHFKLIGVDPCQRIRWDYRYPAGPNAVSTDFYSVMLHELGHFLGLAHQDADPAGTNCMQSFIEKGKRRVIGPKERACLCALYVANCNPTDATKSSWGRVKTLYR